MTLLRVRVKVKLSLFFNIIKELILALAVSGLVLPQTLYAIPVSGQVVQGSATISTSSQNMQINQSTNKAIINWQSYNIGKNEKVNYQQPNSQSIMLNRVNPANGASRIYGQITANGQVWLVNPAGVWFGPSAYVNVAGLLATTAGISDENFMIGRYSFQQDPNWNGAIVNQGTIKIMQAGLLALVGNGVVNNGFIEAEMGTVVLASGSAFTLKFSGNNLISFTVDSESIAPAYDANGRQLRTGVKNTGRIMANGGKILLSARSASEILDNAINMRGVAQVKSVNMHNGELILDGGDGKVIVNAKIDATGKKNNEVGGNVKIIAKNIELKGKTIIDVSGNKGGGEILIGGNAHGNGPLQNAKTTYIGSNVSLKANALVEGNGGKIVAWSDNATVFNGHIEALGGQLGGNGGWVETSGGYLGFNGSVDTSAAFGETGSLLLDPKFIIVATSGGAAYSAGVNNLFANNSSGTTILTPASINAANANITLQANTDITFTDALSMTNAGRTLTVSAGRDILINADITTTNAAITMTANDSTALSADRDTGTGSIVMATGTTISSGTGAITLTVGSSTTAPFSPGDITLNNLTKSTTAAISINSPNAILVNGAINAGSGTITMNTNTNANSAKDFTLASTGSLSTTNTSTSAVAINVNAAAGGTGAIALGGNITTGSGGRITLATNIGANTTGGSITQTAGALSVGSGTLVFSVPTASSSAIGSLATPIATTSTGTLTLTMGSGGAFVTNTGALTLGTPTVTATDFPLQIIASGTLTLPGASIATGTGDLTFSSTGGSLATVATRNLTTTSGNLTLSGATGLTINSILTTGSGNLNLSNTTSGNVTFNAAGNIVSTTGNLLTNSLNVLTISSAINVGSGTVTLNANTNGAGADSFVMGSGSSITTSNTSASAVAVNVNTALGGTGSATVSNITTGSGGTITVKTDTGGNITGGDIVRVAGTTLDVGAGSIILTSPVAAGINIGTAATPIQIVASSLNAVSGASGIIITNNGTSGLDLATINTSGLFTLNSTASSDITDSGPVTVTGVTTLVAGGTQNITLNDSGNNFSTLAITSANNATISDINAIILGASTISGNFNLTTAGAITQSAAIAITGATTLDAGAANNITLTTSTNNFSTVAIASGNAVSLRDAGLIDLGTSTVSGALTITASGAGGGITQSGALAVTGTTTLVTSTTNNITLNNAANDFSTLAITSGNNVVFHDANALILGTSTVTGTLDGTIFGNLTQSGTVIVTGASTFNAGSNDITLTTTANNFSSVGVTAANATFQDANAFVIDTSNVTGNLSVTARGALTQTGSGITANNLIGLTLVNAGAAITLNNTANEVNTIDLRARNAANTTNVSGAISYLDSSGFDVVAANTTSTVNLTAGAAITQSGSMTGTTLTAKTLNNTGADITLNNAANAFTTINLQARNLTDTANTAGAITYVDTNSIVIADIDTTSSFSLTAGTSITQTGTLTVGGATSITASLATTDILLASAANDLSVTPTLATTGAGTIRDFSLRNISATAAVPTLPTGLRNLTLQFDNNNMSLPGVTLTGTLTATATGNNITQTGGLIVSGTSTFSANDITLTDSNNFSTIVLTAGNNVFLNDINALIFGATTVLGSLDTTTNGAITDSGALIISGTATFSAGAANAITLNTATNNFNILGITNSGAVTIVDVSAIVLDTVTASSLTLTTTGNITQNASVTVSGTSAFNAGAANNITLTDSNNNFGTVTITNTDNASITDINALNLGTTTLAGDLTVIAGGALTDSGNIVVNGTNGVTATATGGITLNSGSNQISKLNITNLSSGNIAIISIIPLTITGYNFTSSGSATFTDTGIFSIADGVNVFADAGLNITSTDLNLNTTGSLTSLGTISITQSTNGGSIGLGDSIGTMTISGTELQNMTATTLSLNAPNNGSIVVDNITVLNSANLSNVNLVATTGTLGNITFQNNASSFQAQSVSADNGVTVNANIITSVGNLSINGDAGGGIGGSDGIFLNADLTATGSLSLAATNGGIVLGAPSTLTGTGITISSAINGAFNLALNAGVNNITFSSTVGASTPLGSGIGAAITVNAAGTTTFSNTVAANSGFIITANATFNNNVALNDGDTGTTISGLTTLGNTLTTFNGYDGLNFNGGLTVNGSSKTINSQGSNLIIGLNASHNLTLNTALDLTTSGGDIDINATGAGANTLTADASLSGDVFLQALNTNGDLIVTANNLTGTVNIHALTIDLNTGNFFGTVNGSAGESAIMQFVVLNPLVPNTIFFNGIDITLPQPVPPIPPVPVPNVPPQIVFPTNYMLADYSSMTGFELYSADLYLWKKISKDCLTIGPMITICGFINN